jgi:tetratricopeptide (TPR) repeat protein
LNPVDATAYNNRGAAYAKSNKHEQAIEDYNKAIKLNPDYATAYNNRGVAYTDLNKHEKAIEDYNRAIELNPDYATAYYNRGVAYTDLNKHEKAIEDYGTAIELNLDYAEAYRNRGFVYSNIERYEDSTRDLKKAGILFFSSGRVEDSVKANSLCFKLQDKIENNDIVYCGLTLFLITLNADVIIELRQMKIQDETLRKIFELAVRKLRNRDISEELAEIEEQEKREEMRILLGLLKGF